MNSLIGKALKESKKPVKEDLIDDTRVMEKDHEVNMAKSQLYKTAKYAIELHNMLNNVSEEKGLPGWVQSKITMSADYLSKVKHYMEYENKPDVDLSLDVEPHSSDAPKALPTPDKDTFESLLDEYKSRCNSKKKK